MMIGQNRELIFAFIAPIGVNRTPVLAALRNELSKVGYRLADPIHVSDQLTMFAKKVDEHDYIDRKNSLMDAGNKIRKWHQMGDAVALLLSRN